LALGQGCWWRTLFRSRIPFEPDSVEGFLLKVAFLAAIFLLALLISYMAQ
jgi:hypothetical protein